MKNLRKKYHLSNYFLILSLILISMAPCCLHGASGTAAPSNAILVPTPVLVDIAGGSVTLKVPADDSISTNSVTGGSMVINVSPAISPAAAPKSIQLVGPARLLLNVAGTASIATTAGTISNSPAVSTTNDNVLTVNPGHVSVSATTSDFPLTVSVTVNEPDSPVLTNSMKKGSNFDIMAGIVTINPFRIGTNVNKQFVVMPDNTDTSATIQVNYYHRLAWSAYVTNSGSIFHCDRTNWDWAHWDLQARGAYNFSSSDTNASTIIGSGNTDLEFNVGKPLFWSVGKNYANSFNLEAGVQVSTDRQFSEAHSTIFVGPAYATSFLSPLSTTNYVYLLFRAGAANYEMPKLLANDVIAPNGAGFPDFHRVWGLDMEMEARYQLGPGSFISAGARVYPTHSIAPWSLWVGYSATLDKIIQVATTPFK